MKISKKDKRTLFGLALGIIAQDYQRASDDADPEREGSPAYDAAGYRVMYEEQRARADHWESTAEGWRQEGEARGEEIDKLKARILELIRDNGVQDDKITEAEKQRDEALNRSAAALADVEKLIQRSGLAERRVTALERALDNARRAADHEKTRLEALATKALADQRDAERERDNARAERIRAGEETIKPCDATDGVGRCTLPRGHTADHYDRNTGAVFSTEPAVQPVGLAHSDRCQETDPAGRRCTLARNHRDAHHAPTEAGSTYWGSTGRITVPLQHIEACNYPNRRGEGSEPPARCSQPKNHAGPHRAPTDDNGYIQWNTAAVTGEA